MRSFSALVITCGCALLIAACGSSSGSSGKGSSDGYDLVVYSGREEELARPLYKRFEKDTGLKLKVRYAESPEMALSIREEGTNSPADVFYAQDAGAIGSVGEFLDTIPAPLLGLVNERWRDPKARWIGVTGRARTLIYNTEMVKPSELPKSVFELTDKRYKGKVALAPTNASFQAFVSAMRLSAGEDKTSSWLKDMKKSDGPTFEKNSQIADAVAKGEVPMGLVNHYYLYETLEHHPKAPIKLHFFADGDPGNLVNVSAVGILRTTKHRKASERFVKYLLEEGQVFIANDAEEREYPLNTSVKGLERAQELPPLDRISGPDVSLGALGTELPASVKMIDESGLVS